MVQLIKPWHRVSVGLLDHNHIRVMRPQPGLQVLARSRQALRPRRPPKAEHTARHEPAAVKHGVAEISKSGVEGEDGVIRGAHGV